MPLTISGDTPNFSAATITAGTVTTLNAPSGVLATQNGMTGIAKAWVQFAGATGTIAGSFNVSSVTRNSAGNYTINYTTAMPNTNYAPVVSAGETGNSDSNANARISNVATTSTSMIVKNASFTAVDYGVNTLAAFSS